MTLTIFSNGPYRFFFYAGDRKDAITLRKSRRCRGDSHTYDEIILNIDPGYFYDCLRVR